MRAIVSGLVAAFLLSAAPVLADGGLDRVLAAKTLVVAVTPNAPWVVKRPDGTLTGYDIDIVNALAKDMGVAARYVEVPYPDLVGQVVTDRADLATAGLAITPQRALVAVFSAPTGLSVVRTVAAGKDGHKIAAGGAGTTIAVLAGSTDEAAARAFYPKASFLTFPDSNAALSALINGQAQAMVATSPVPRMATHIFDGHLKLVGPPLAKTAEAIAMRPEDTRLKAYVDNWLTARTTDGFLANLREHWFSSFGWIKEMQPIPKERAAGGR